MAVLTITLDGEERTVDTERDLVIEAPESERYETAALIAHWGIVLASLEAEVERAKARIDHWYAKSLKAYMANDPKLSEWKGKTFVEGMPQYEELMIQLADFREQAAKVQAVYNGYMKKHDMLGKLVDRDQSLKGRSGTIGRESSGPDPRFNKFREGRQNRQSGE